MKKNNEIYSAPTIIGVSGGSGAGKTTLCKEVIRHCPIDITVISQDHYYRDMGRFSNTNRKNSNYDRPEAIDNDLLLTHLQALKQSASVEVPEYNFKTHIRTPNHRVLHSARVIIVEGIMLFAVPELRNICDVKVYVHVDPDIRFIRRIRRDIKSRGRSLESVINQYLETVKAMHNKYVQPHREQADLILNGLKLPLAVKQFSEFIKSISEANYDTENFNNYTILQPGTVFGIHHSEYPLTGVPKS